MTKIKISIGIPAYNEQANIKNLLNSILAQKQDDFEIVEIIVVSDSSTDRTNDLVATYPNSLVRLVVSEKRKGKALEQNELFHLMTGDIFVLFDADIILASDETIHWLIQPLVGQHGKTALVSGLNLVSQPRNSFQKALNIGVMIKERTFSRIRNGNNQYLCAGRIRAFSKEFAKILVWPEAVSEDAYSYLFCKYHGFDFVYQKKATIIFKNPDNYQDHKKQSDRFRGSLIEMYKYFPKDFVDENHNWPMLKMLISLWYYFFRDPVSVLFYVLIYLRTHLSKVDPNMVVAKWPTVKTSKDV